MQPEEQTVTNDQTSAQINLTVAEKRLIEAAASGRVANYDIGNPEADNPLNGPVWGEDRTIRAGIIVKLCVEVSGGWSRHPRGIRVKGARVVDDLDFEGTTLSLPLFLTNCFFEKPINFQDSQTRILVLDGSIVSGMRADRMVAQGSVHMLNGFRATGEVSFFLATVNGVLDCSSATFSNPDGIAFNGTGITVKGLNLRHGFTARGEVRLLNAVIGNHLDCQGGTFDGKESALNGDGIETGGAILLRSRLNGKGELERFTAKGTIRLYGAKIGGNLECQGASFENPNGNALNAECIVTGGYVFLRSLLNSKGEPLERFTAKGTVRLFRAAIGIDLDCQGGTFDAKEIALDAEGIKIGGSILLRSRFSSTGELIERFSAKGTVRLYGANIGGNLDCQGATFENINGNAIEADSIVTRGAALLRARFDSKGEPIERFTAKGTVRLFRAEIGGNLEFQGALLENPKRIALHGYGLTTRGDAILNQRFRALGEVQLSNGQIGNQLDCGGATFENPDGRALNAEGIKTGGSVFLRSRFSSNGKLLERFSAKGIVRLYGANIGGNLECQGATFENINGNAIEADSIVTRGAALLRARFDNKGEPIERFTAKGSVRLVGAEIGGNLEFHGALLELPNGIAFQGYGLKSKGDVILKEGFRASGEVRLSNAEVGNHLDCEGATFENPDGRALNAEGIKTGGSVLLRSRFSSNGELLERFTAKGIVRLFRAEIGADLDCQGGFLESPRRIALQGYGLVTKGNVLFRHGFRTNGEIQLISAEIGNNLDCDGGTFENAGGTAINGDRTVIGGSVTLRARCDTRGKPIEPFTAAGTVRLVRADIGDDLDCSGARFEKPAEGIAFDGYGLTTKGDVLFKSGFGATGLVSLDGALVAAAFDCSGAKFTEATLPPEALDPRRVPLKATRDGLSLVHASVGRLIDEESAWPSAGKLYIDSFVYGSLGSDSPTSAKNRLDWIHLQPEGDFRPQPYEQLARVLRQMGREGDAREILIAKQNDLRKSGRLGRFSRVWNWFLAVTISHGYEPWKALIPMVIFICLGWFVFHKANVNGVMKPPKLETSANPDSKNCTEKYPCLNSLVYSIDAFLPIIDLNQDKYWVPDASIACGDFLLPAEGKPCGAIYRGYLWLHMFAGYILTTLLVVALTGLVKKD